MKSELIQSSWRDSNRLNVARMYVYLSLPSPQHNMDLGGGGGGGA